MSDSRLLALRRPLVADLGAGAVLGARQGGTENRHARTTTADRGAAAALTWLSDTEIRPTED